ncbi:albusnodin/ikarugamycin family macrolactam cyclase [Streptomyces hiroshimensis]|uniref:albusnodin/ikarugamycin family macrolactam cyclase n=1 Tax=Streptomyces hiroshimensis TaxID=66424 RepID=UPI00227D7B83|nr:albusnodin/ikarugamycin family macrolactam cyclase [Streptomyces hiroshimensis]
MRWCTGWEGGPASRQPEAGRPVTALGETWTAGWPEGQVRTAGAGAVALAVVGVCGASDRQLEEALPVVTAQQWRALTRWPGSYLVVARSGPTLAVIGDLSGQHPVYYRREAAGTWWATSATALAALDGAPADPVALAAHLAFGQPDVLASRSLFRTVNRVPTGHLLQITPEGARTIRYEPTEYEPVSMREAAPTVQAALAEAIAVRMDGRPVSADLAGLDSTTLACLAARHRPVTAVTFADERLRDDDLAYAQRTAAVVPHLHHHKVPGAQETIYYAGLEDASALPFTDTPNAFAVSAAVKRTVLDAVIAHQTAPGVHLTGVAGDGLLSASPSYLADLLRERQRPRAWQHAQGHARLRQTSVWSVLGRARPAARIGLADGWRQAAAELHEAPRQWEPQARRPIAWTPLLATADWMSIDVRHQLADALTTAADELTEPPERLAAWTDSQDLARIGADASGWRTLALDEHGIEIAAPYLDNEVRRACLAVPADQRGTPSRYKPLLAEAFAGTDVLPDFVLERATKGGFNALSYAGLVQHAPALRRLLGPSSRLGAMGLVTDGPVGAMLARAAAGQATAQGALHVAVVTEVWLRQLEQAGALWEVTGRVAAA